MDSVGGGIAAPADWQGSDHEEPRGFFARVVPAFRYRDFRLLVIGLFSSLTGYWVMYVTQAWLALELTGSNAWVAIVSFAESLPVLVISIWAGVLADRVDRKRLMLVVRTIVAAILLGEAILAATGLLNEYGLVAFGVAMGALTALDIPVRVTLVTDLVPAEFIENGMAAQQAVWNTTSILGPAIGGVLLAVVGASWAFGVTAAGNVVLVLVILAMRIPARPTVTEKQSAFRQAREGFAFVKSHPVVGPLIVTALVMTLFWSGYFVLLPSLARDVFDTGTSGYGALTAVSGAGALIGSLLVVAVTRRQRKRARLLMSGAVCLCLSLVGLAVSPYFAVALVAMFVAGFTGDVYYTLSNTVIVTTTPDGLRGRVMSIQTFVWGLAPAGALFAGVVADQTDVRSTFAICGAAALVATLGVFAAFGELRRI